MPERIEMSGKEVKRLELLRQVADGVVSLGRAGQALGLSDRQLRWGRRRYEREGAVGLVSRHRGQPSNRRFAELIKDAMVDRVRERYADFSPTLVAEYLRSESFSVSKETLCGWMIAEGLWQAGTVRRKFLHSPCPRPQFQRATAALDRTTIQALSPQAKGRVERLFQTWSDRLVKALRLGGIRDIAAANARLSGHLAEHHTRFADAPENPEDAHTPYAGDAPTRTRLCATHRRRKLPKDLVLSFNRQRYLVQTGGAPRYALRGSTVGVVLYPDGRIGLLHGQAVLPYKVFNPVQMVPTPVDDKTLNTGVDDILKAHHWSEKSHLAPHHPWRRYPASLSPGDGSSATP